MRTPFPQISEKIQWIKTNEKSSRIWNFQFLEKKMFFLHLLCLIWIIVLSIITFLFIERKSCTVGMYRCVVIFFNFVKSKLILLDIINGLFYQTFRCFYTNPQAFSVRTSRQRHFLRNLSDNVLRSTDMWKCQKKNLVEILASWSFLQGIWRGEYPFRQ